MRGDVFSLQGSRHHVIPLQIVIGGVSHCKVLLTCGRYTVAGQSRKFQSKYGGLKQLLYKRFAKFTAYGKFGAMKRLIVPPLS